MAHRSIELRLSFALLWADLRDSSLSDALLDRAVLYGAQLQGASLLRAEFPGASLHNARLQGASFSNAKLQGASLDAAQLQGASLIYAHLQGASLDHAQLQGADLRNGHLQGADLTRAQFQGASFDYAQLQGAFLRGSSMTSAKFAHTYVWRAKHASCSDARVTAHKADAIVEVRPDTGITPVQSTPDEIAIFIEQSTAGISELPQNFVQLRDSRIFQDIETIRSQMRAGLVNPTQDDTAAIEEAWTKCETTSAEASQKEFDRKHVELLRNLVCEGEHDRAAVARGIIRNWILYSSDDFSARLARGLLGQDGRECAGTIDLDETTKQRLRAVIAAAPDTPPAAVVGPQGSSAK